MNLNYSKILKAGYNIEIRSQSFATARVYLTLNNVRTGRFAEFKGGHFNAGILAEKAKHARPNTHIDRALAYLCGTAEVETALLIVEERDRPLLNSGFTVSSYKGELPKDKVSKI